MSSIDGSANPSRVPQILAGTIIPILLASVFVVGRLYTRYIITKNWGNDDTLITIAWISSLGLAVTNILFVPFGAGHHQIFQKESQIVPTLKLAFIGRLIYQFVLCLTKLGICVFYLRVFQDKTSKYIVYIIVAFVTVSALVIELVFIFQCSPVSDAWNFVNPNCKPANPSVIANTVCNILADVVIMAFAIPRVLPLQMRRRQKVSLLMVVGLGVLVIAASIVRCYLVTMLADNDDLPWNGYEITTWSTVEVATGLFCASAPCIRPLLRQIAPGFMSSISQTFSGPSRARTHTGPSSKYGIGSVAGKSKRGEAFELNSTGGDGRGTGTFWVGEEESGKRRSADEGSEVSVLPSRQVDDGGKGDIVKTVSVSVTSDAGVREESPQRAVHGWQNV
ncbi:related to integral membrane protein [Phialocephala subalpina]|uniref:Related to integral membrane protein n=1 Tax=Phialocephala subalpina TaxID=576137 RepID=A0A1L7XQQ3_9HELO|nr:related to integral membrane protein [Phialocephala subalpina]